MIYRSLANYIEANFNDLPQIEVVTPARPRQAQDAARHQRGRLVRLVSLAVTRYSSSLPPKQGTAPGADHPYSGTGQHLGGFFNPAARDLNEADRGAPKHPASHLNEHMGWDIEVRPVAFFEQS